MAKDMYQKRKERQENKKNETYEDKKTNINCLIRLIETPYAIPYNISA